MTDTLKQKWTEMEATQRVTILSRVPGLLRRLGHRPEDVLEPLGIDPQLLSDPAARIPYRLASAIVAECSAATQIQHFGLTLGAEVDHFSLGPLGTMMAHAPDLETALIDFVLLQQANSRSAVIYLRRAKTYVFLGYGIYDSAVTAHDQVYALFTAVCVGVIRLLTTKSARPEEVLLSFSKPADTTPYTKLFGCPVYFDQPETGLTLSRSTLSMPLPGADERRYAELKAAAAALLPRSENYWADRVRHRLRPLLLRGMPNTAQVAAELDLTVRSLSRRLAKEGTSVGTLLEEIRYAAARELLAVTRLSIGDISTALAYSQPSAFVTAFRRWSGTTPQQWRKSSGR
jgi:AraC-like DNA-binding protein